MKSVNRLNNASLPTTKMTQIKGGATVNIETLVEITTVSTTGAVNVLFCDRRRKLVNT